jgi:diguanylate cyclase (GGDEF)-like protein
MTETLRVVIVEDSGPDAELLARRLTKAGFSIDLERVETEPDFVRALAEGNPHLIFSDFSLPNFSGFRALEVAAERAPNTPFIYVSGTIGEERAIDALHRGATDYVLKGNLTRLPSVVERALKDAALQAQQRLMDEERREQEERLRRLTRSYRMLSSTNSAFLRLRDRAELLGEVCRIAVHQGGYDYAALYFYTGTNSRRLEPRAVAGKDGQQNPSDPMWTRLSEQDVVRGAIDSGMPRALNEIADERERSELMKCRALCALPLLVDGTSVGALVVFSSEADVFDEAETKILLELSSNLGFALQYLQKDEAIHYLSYFDSLTGLAKRQLFCQRLTQRLEASPDGRLHTVAAFDVQKLGLINDSLGRHSGDRLLEQIAVRIRESCSDSEHVGYLGGGTFALLLEEPLTADSAIMPEMLKGALDSPVLLDGEELRPAVRCGLAMYPSDADNAEQLVQSAEAALAAARQGNDKVKWLGQISNRANSRSLALEARLSRALDREEFLLYYQPKFRICSGQLDGFEALLRWNDTKDGLVSPAQFVPLLERSGAIAEVGAWVLLQAVKELRGWYETSLIPVRVAVNVSPFQLRQRDFVDRFLSIVSGDIGSAAGGIDIEITESMLMRDVDLSIRKLGLLREAGVAVAIDDFGTGYSSLSLLGRLPIDTLKIDRSFVQGIERTNAATLVRTIISLARLFNMGTVAEGVESAQQLAILRTENCDQAQGYLLGRPIPAKDVPHVIARFATTAGAAVTRRGGPEPAFLAPAG